MATVVSKFVSLWRFNISQIQLFKEMQSSNVTDLPIKCYKVKCQGISHVTNVIGCTGKYLKTTLNQEEKMQNIENYYLKLVH